jgi:DNA-binding transcriptional LysR family regulator
MLSEVERGALDLGIVRYPLAESTGVRLVPVESDRLVAVLPPGSALAARKRLALKDLSQEPFVLYSADGATNLRAQVVTACQSAGFSPKVAQEAVQVQTVLSLVESGLGVALVPAACQVHASKNLTFREFAGSDELLRVALAVATRAGVEPPAARKFRELLLSLADPSPEHSRHTGA